MRPALLRDLLKAQPFEPICVGLSDGRSVLIQHPDQAVVSQRHLYVGLAKLKRAGSLASPRSGETITRDWLFVNLTHVVSVEPENGVAEKRKSGRRKQ